MTGREKTFPENELIVSKTDKTGRITYVNDVFIGVSGYTETEAKGQPHSIVRHPDTPRCLFKLMWDMLGHGEEVFVYINNLAKNGDHYWVFAHVTPDLDPNGDIIGYHSNRRVPRRDVIKKLEPLYKKLFDAERSHASSKDGLEASSRLLNEVLKGEGKNYDEFVLSL
ncbi:PAS domain-containing protein [Telmatospirillum siberiense]|nr:PAS domain-containing protein [Telmatospirillum siberiense]